MTSEVSESAHGARRCEHDRRRELELEQDCSPEDKGGRQERGERAGVEVCIKVIDESKREAQKIKGKGVRKQRKRDE